MTNNWTSVLHHTNFGGCEKLALGFLENVESNLIVFQLQSDIINKQFAKIPNAKKFARKISIREPFSIYRARKSIPFEKKGKQIFILWHGRFSLLATIFVLYKRNARFLVHIGTNVENVKMSERLSMRLIRSFLKNQIKFVCVSINNRETFLEEFPFFKTNTFVIANGIAPSKMAVSKTYSEFEFAMVSRFDDSKFQELIIRTLDQRSLGEGIVLIGDGPNLPNCQALSAQLGISSKVKFLGNQPEPFANLDSSQIFIFSADEREGFGLVVYEAIASGLRVIASDIPAVKQIIRDDRFLFTNDIASLSKTINFAKTNVHEHWETMNGIKSEIMKSFSLPVMHSKYLDLWQE